ncbi:MAG: signal peptide peptidase SppA [Prevotellaceae bacterium]|jgi:protease-4|nr:signal peptide peptidase SppA [Prevotellaceae bacterium]
MKQFFKMMLATIAGIVIISFVGFFLLVAIISVADFSGSKPVDLRDNSVLKIALNKQVEDREASNPLSYLDPLTGTINMPDGLNNILRGIEKATFDPRIKGIYLDLNDVKAGIATVEEIRNAIVAYKQSGKFVIAYADEFSQKAYYLATIADKIYMNPHGQINFIGLSSEIMSYKGLMDKLGIEMQILRHGKFKAAVEPFSMTEISPENREQISVYMGSIWNTMLQAISSERNISIDELNRLADLMEPSTAVAAVDRGFIDKLIYKDELVSELCKYTESASESDLRYIAISDYAHSPSTTAKYSEDKIAIIYASGEIARGEGPSGVMSVDISKAIRQAKLDKAVKAIVFRINSPGGDALASEIIARELELAQQIKPVIVSMGNLAASGGYWIASPAEAIVANRTTITGSIGVFGMAPNLKKAMNENLGLNVSVVGTNKYSDYVSIYRPLSETEKNRLQKTIEDIYSKFIDKVSKFRHLKPEEVDCIGQGRVWSGENALDNSLIDRIGGLTEAVALAAERAGISNYRTIDLPREQSSLEKIMSLLGTHIREKAPEKELQRALRHYEYISSAVSRVGIMARMSYNIEID